MRSWQGVKPFGRTEKSEVKSWNLVATAAFFDRRMAGNSGKVRTATLLAALVATELLHKI